MKKLSWILLCLLPLWVSAAPTLGDSLPNFTRENIAGKEISLSALKGKVVILDFWAVYCKPCRAELPILSKWQEKYQKKGLFVLSVNVDPETQEALNFLKDNPVNFEVVFDPDDTIREGLGNPEMPAIFLLDRKGKLRLFHRGVLSEDDKEFSKALKAALSER